MCKIPKLYGSIKGSEPEGQGSPCRWGRTAANLGPEGKFAGKKFFEIFLAPNHKFSALNNLYLMGSYKIMAFFRNQYV